MANIEKKLLSETNLKKEYNVVIPVDCVKEEVENQLKKVQLTYKMDGFRAGKVPAETIRKREGDRLFFQASEELMNKTIEGLIEEETRKIAMKPDVDVKKFDLNSDVEFNVVVEFMPDVPEVKLEDIKLDEIKIEVRDEDVEKSVNRLLSMHKKYTEQPAETISKDGDTVKIDFCGKIDGKEFAGGAATDYQLKLGSHSFIDNFEDQLIGKKAGDKIAVNVTFPENYGSKELAGKPAVFDVTIKAVMLESDQDLTDEFVSEKFGVENVAKFREIIKGELEKQFDEISKNNLKNKFFAYLKDNIKIELPEGMFKNQFENMWKYKQEELTRNPKMLEGTTKEEIEQKTKEEAKNSLTLGLILSDFGEKNNVSINDAEITKELTKKALSMPGYEEMFMKYYRENKEALNALKAEVLENKIIDSMLEKIHKNEVKMTIDEFEKNNK